MLSPKELEKWTAGVPKGFWGGWVPEFLEKLWILPMMGSLVLWREGGVSSQVL
jgi:hypothetical protein